MESPIQTNLNAGVQSLERFNRSIEELRDYEKKNLRINRIRMLCSLLLVVLCAALLVVFVINARTVVRNVDDVTEVVTETANQMNEVAEDLNKVDFEQLGKSLQELADIGGDTLQQVYEATGGLDVLVNNADEAMTHINSIDYENLNNGIQRLNDILEPIAKFFNIFH